MSTLTTRKETSARAAQSTMPELFRKAQAFERAFVKAGGLLGAGVDPTGMGGALPGYGDQRNFELLIEAGFSPVEAIQIMTLNGARVLARRQSPRLGGRRQGRRPGGHPRESGCDSWRHPQRHDRVQGRRGIRLAKVAGLSQRRGRSPLTTSRV